MIKNYKIKTLIPNLVSTIPDETISHYCNDKLGIKNIKCIKPSSSLADMLFSKVCFNYAFDNEELYYLIEAIDYLVENYNQITLAKLKVGDIITYGTKRNIKHFGIIHKTDNTLKGTIIRSKWGICGVFETDLYSIPKGYGNIINFWERSNNG